MQDYMVLVQEAATLTAKTGNAWLKLAVLLVTFVFNSWWEFETQLEPFWVLVQVILLLALLATWFLWRFIQRRRYIARVRSRYSAACTAISTRYHSFIFQVEAKSRWVAAVFPHVLFFAIASALSWLFPAMSSRLVDGVGLVPIALTFPGLVTLFAIPSKKHLSAELTSANVELLEHWLQYWVVCGSLVGILTALSAVTSIAALSRVCFFIFLWLFLPVTDGAIGFMYGVMEALFGRYVRRVEIDNAAHAQQGMLLLRTLATIRVISSTTAELWSRLIRDSFIVVLGLVFLFTPNFLTHFGLIYVGLLCPIYLSIEALKLHSQPATVKWLTYWAAFGLVMTIRATDAAGVMIGMVWFNKQLQLLALLYLVLIGANPLVSRLRSYCPSPVPNSVENDEDETIETAEQPQEQEGEQEGEGERGCADRKKNE